MFQSYRCTGEGNLTDISVYAYKRLTRDGLLNLTADAVEKVSSFVTGRSLRKICLC